MKQGDLEQVGLKQGGLEQVGTEQGDLEQGSLEQVGMKQGKQSEEIVVVTDRAVERFRALIEEESKRRHEVVCALRLSLKKGGCAGMSFDLDYVPAAKARRGDIRQRVQGVDLHIDPVATMFLLGTEIDHRETNLSSGFVFTSPKATARCGCGESVGFG